MHKRGSGILLHIISLPSPFGIGDMGIEAFRFADFLAQTNQSFWQVLPLNPTDPNSDFSPYSSISSFALNPLLISPHSLKNENLIPAPMIVPFTDSNSCRVDYPKSLSYKMSLLETAFISSQKNGLGSDFKYFCEHNSSWLDNHALFTVLSNHFKSQSWNQWPQPLRDRDPQALSEFLKKNEHLVIKEKYFQYLLMQQWKKLRQYCNDLGIQIIGDLPMFVNYDSVDVWAYRQFFKLNQNLQPTFFSGAPPDRFSPHGQLWHNPVYNWDSMQKDRYSWWIHRFQRSFELFDILRIDHFRGLVAYWETSAEYRDATQGSWQNVPVDDFFNTIFKHFFCFPVIAEDLGTITPDVRETMERFTIPGTKVLLFAFENKNPHHPYLPHNYGKECMACTGTHDTNTIRGWYESDSTEKEQQNFSDYIGAKADSGNINWKAIRLLMSSAADMVIFPLQDILGHGTEARMNTPGTGTGNWRWRFTPDALSEDIKKKLSELTVIYGRS